MPDLGKIAHDILGFDITPGFNLGWKQTGNSSSVTMPTFTSTGDNPRTPQVEGRSRTASRASNSTGANDSSAIYNGPSGDSDSSSSNGADISQALFQIDQSLKQYQDALGRIKGQQSTALDNIKNDYNGAYNRLLGQQGVADRNYETNQNNQIQDYQGSRDQIANNQRDLVLNARRMLGGQGAGGGSADRFAVPNAAQNQASNQNAVVQQTNARNLSALNTAHDDDRRNFQNSFEDLSGQLDKSNRNTKSQYGQQQADILNAIAQLTGQRTIAQGGSTQSALAAASPYTSRISGILNNIDALAANPAQIREQSVNLARPDLAQYTYDRFTAPTSNAQAPQDMSLPLAAILGGQNSDQRRQLLGL